MRIGIVTTSFPRYEGDPAGSFVFGMARAFDRKGHAITVLAPCPSDPVNCSEAKTWLGGIELVQVPYIWPRSLGRLFYGAGVPDNIAARPWSALEAPAAVLSFAYSFAMHSHALDAVISHWLIPSALEVGLVRRRRLKHLAIAHSSDVSLFEQLPFRRYLAKKTLSWADHIGFVTPKLEKRFSSILCPEDTGMLRGRTSITPMGIDLLELNTKRSRAQIRKELGLRSFSVLFLGRLVDIKGLDSLIDAAAGINGVELIIAGNGPLRLSLEKRTLDLGVIARFTGEIGPKKRAELLKACDVVAVPSRRLANGREEGSPMAIKEAIGAGRPVLVTHSADSENTVQSIGCGIAVPSDDLLALKQALIAMKSDRSLLKGYQQNARKAASNLDWSSLISKYEELLRAD